MSGIKYFSTKTKGIGGSIKRRIIDFKVREICEDGCICELKSFDDRTKRILEKKWPQKEEGKDQLKLTLEKYNTDLNQAIKLISRAQGVSTKRIGYAGLKDKRAITAQKITIWNPDYEKVKSMNFSYFDLRDAEWSNERIEIGSLKGNMFEIIIRKIELDNETIKERIEKSFKEMEKGMLNYFGEQRFGGIRNISHRVGKEFVKGNIENAVMLYLTAVSEKEDEDVTEARKHLEESRDFNLALKEFPKKYKYERGMIQHLHNNKNDFTGAFRILPKSMRYLFTHAYQSYLFNKVINKRVEAGIGINETEGDVMQDNIPTGPLFGFKSKFPDGIPGKLEMEVLEEEQIEQKDFMNREMHELSSKGARKKISLFPQNLKLLEIGDDEFNEEMKKARISFSLNKGDYATSVLRELMKD